MEEGKGKLNGLARFLDKKVKVIYDDGAHITLKIGILIDSDNDFLFLDTEEGEEAISKTKIIRMELQNSRKEMR